VIDIWKRPSRIKTIINQTFPLTSRKRIFFNKIIDQNLLDQSISCYYLHNQLLFINFNQSKFQMLNHINNLTIFNNYNRIVFTNILYSSFIYSLNEKNFKYKIQLTISTSQLEYLGKIYKDCEDFYPMYLPFICSIRLIDRNRYHLRISNHNKQIQILQSNKIFYRINQNYYRRKNINDMHQVRWKDV
jgi:hypothetical protein